MLNHLALVSHRSGLAAGGLAAIFGTPADVSLIRMQADATMPVEQRRNYTVRSNLPARFYPLVVSIDHL